LAIINGVGSPIAMGCRVSAPSGLVAAISVCGSAGVNLAGGKRPAGGVDCNFRSPLAAAPNEVFFRGILAVLVKMDPEPSSPPRALCTWIWTTERVTLFATWAMDPDSSSLLVLVSSLPVGAESRVLTERVLELPCMEVRAKVVPEARTTAPTMRAATAPVDQRFFSFGGSVRVPSPGTLGPAWGG